MEEYEFGHTSVSLYGEHYYAPYWRGGVLTRRVISLLLPVRMRNTQVATPTPYQIEFL